MVFDSLEEDRLKREIMEEAEVYEAKLRRNHGRRLKQEEIDRMMSEYFMERDYSLRLIRQRNNQRV